VVDILRGAVGATSSYVFGWVIPLAFATLTFVFVVLQPSGVRLDDGIRSGDATLALVAFGIGALAGGLILSALATPLYRILEGHSWPRSWREAGLRRQEGRKRQLEVRLRDSTSDLERALVAERLDRYPIDDGHLAPTSFGNAMRAFETFGVDRYRLDSQGLWVELTAAAPEYLRGELGRARAAVDFFVAEVFLATVFAGASLAVWLSHPLRSPVPLVASVAAGAFVPLFYRGAVASTTYWDSAVRALVNLGRVPLAEQLGLRMPDTLADERLMWERVAALNYYPFDESWVTLLDEFRPEDVFPTAEDHRRQSRTDSSDPGTDSGAL
jgi:hypothetical protein